MQNVEVEAPIRIALPEVWASRRARLVVLVRARRGLIAAPWHTASVLLFFAYMVFTDAHHAQVAVSTAGPVTRSVIIRGYLLSILFGCGMATWCWAGVQWRGGTLRDLTGGRWKSWRDVMVDVAIAIPL
jgi:hypothetical protein